MATTLGIVLLFVMAASRGWITPSMRVGIGLAVSLLVLVAAVELDRRKWRADAILAATGVGIAGLYTTLWASISAYHLISAPAAAPLSALIATIAVGLAIRIKQEPLALFGMSAAMLAPVLVSHHVTAGGVLFAAVMIAAALPLYVRLRWLTVILAVWAIGLAETLVLLGASSFHPGFGLAVVATAVGRSPFRRDHVCARADQDHTHVGRVVRLGHRRKRIYALARRGVPLRRRPAVSRPLAGRADADRGGAGVGDPGRDPVRCAASARQPGRRPRRHLH